MGTKLWLGIRVAYSRILYNCRGCLLQQVSRDPSAQSEPRGPRRAEVISEIALGDVLGSVMSEISVVPVTTKSGAIIELPSPA